MRAFYWIAIFTLILLLAALCFYFGVYVEYVSTLRSWVMPWKNVIGILGALLTPIITLIIARFASIQWQLQNFIPLKETILKAQEIYYIESQDLLKEYEGLSPKEKKLEKILQDFNGRKQVIISKYLDSLEALALFLKHKIVPEEITKDFFREAIITALNESLQKYIADIQNQNPKYYVNIIELVDRWKQGEPHA